MNTALYIRLCTNMFNVLEYLFIFQHEEKRVSSFGLTAINLGFRSHRFKLCPDNEGHELSEEKFCCVFSIRVS